MEYEINFLVLQSKTEDLEKIKQEIKEIIEAQEGSITDILEYKKRKLAYKINHQLYGFYTVYRFKIKDNSLIEKLKNELNLYQDIARYIIVKADELPALQKEVPQQPAQPSEEKKINQEEARRMVTKKEQVEKSTEEKEISQEEKREEDKKEVQSSQDKKSQEEQTETSEEKTKSQSKDENLEDLDKKLDEILSI